MDVEPLKTLLDNSGNIKETILYYLDTDVKKKIINFDYEEETFYMDERIAGIKRNTLQLDFIGRVICINDNTLTIKLNNVRNISLDKDKYYIFIKPKKKEIKKRDFMKQLLEKL